jgi:hypothetical protein
MWTATDVQIALDDELCEGAVATARIRTPAGELRLIANVERYDSELILTNLHVQSESVLPNSLGWNRLRQIARVVAEKADVEFILVKGAARTTGARPGRTPGELRFSRALPPQRR